MQTRITPLLQQQLTDQIGNVRKCIDHEYYIPAYNCLKTLIGMLNKTDKAKMKEYTQKIDKQIITQSLNNRRSDRIRNLKNQQTIKRNIIATNIRELFEAVMDTMYEGGYMEIEGIKPTHEEGTF